MRETDIWPFIPAAHFTVVGNKRRKVRLVVIHDMEWPETTTAAEDCARYFATTDRQASAHICVDSDSIIQCVRDNDVAWAAPGCNNDGIQIEMSGYARQSAAQWLDPYSILVINNAANATAQYCLKYSIPLRHLTNAELLAGRPGIIGHYQASEVYKRSSHSDPGPNFPWKFFMERVNQHYALRARKKK